MQITGIRLIPRESVRNGKLTQFIIEPKGINGAISLNGIADIKILDYDRDQLTIEVVKNSSDISLSKGRINTKELKGRTIADLKNTELIKDTIVTLKLDEALSISGNNLIAYGDVQGSSPGAGKARILISHTGAVNQEITITSNSQDDETIKDFSLHTLPVTRDVWTPESASTDSTIATTDREVGEVLADPDSEPIEAISVNDAPNSYDRNRGPWRDLRAAQNRYCEQQVQLHFDRHRNNGFQEQSANASRTPEHIARSHQFKRWG